MAYLANRCGVLANVSARTLNSDSQYAAVELYSGYPDSLLMIGSACCMISMIIGIPGNLITILALAYYKKVHNATATFIINAITINRYILIVYPRLYHKIYRKRNLTVMLAAIWISPLLALIPTYLGEWGCFGLDPEDGSCSVVPDQNNRSSKKFIFITVLGLPCIPIFFCYGRIFCTVRKTRKRSQIVKTLIQTRSSSNEETTTHDTSSIIVRFPDVTSNNNEEKREYIPLGINANLKSNHSIASQHLEPPTEIPRIRRNMLKRSMKFLKHTLPTCKDKRLGTMILAIMTSFCLCYLPTLIIEMLRGITLHPQLNIATNILLYFSCCLNPVIYVVMSKEYQKAYRNLFKCHIYIKKWLIDFCGLNRDTNNY